MKTLHRALLFGLLAAVCFWLVDAVLDFLFFYEGTFLELLVLNVPSQKVYIRLTVIGVAAIVALVGGILETRRERAEEALRASEGQLHTLIESSHEVIFCKDREGHYHTMNLNAAIGLGGTCIEDIAGKTDYELLPKEQADALRRTDEYIMESGKNTELEEVVRNAQGENRLYLSHKWPTYDDEGKITGIACFAMDITERKNTERALRESEQLFRLMVETAFDGINICEYDADTGTRRLVSCNDHYVKMSGHTREQLVNAANLNDLVVLHGSARENARQHDCLVNGAPFTGLSSWKRPDGKENVYEWSAIAVKKDGKFHIIGVDRDVTERRKAEEKLRDYRRQLQELPSKLVLAEERLRRRIARDLHDDVGQDLLSVKMQLGELRKSASSPEQADSLEEILKSVEKAIQDTRSLLFDLSPPVLYELGFEPAVEWLTEKLQADHGIAAVFEDDGQAKLLTDDLRIGLFRAVRELLVNIVKHAQAKNMKVSARREGPNIRVEVEDDGVGFDVEKTQVPGDLSKGFGLFDIRERLRHFGGSFHLQSKPGQGTQVTLLAPLKQEKLSSQGESDEYQDSAG